MMINKRLIGAVPDCKSHIAANVAFQWLSLIANIAMMAAIAHFLGSFAAGSLDNATIGITVLVTANLNINVSCSTVRTRLLLHRLRTYILNNI